MTRLVPRPDWTPEDVAAAIWAVASSLSDQRYLQLNTPDRIEAFARLPAVLALFRPAEEPGIITATADHARPLEPIPWDDDYPRETPAPVAPPPAEERKKWPPPRPEPVALIPTPTCSEERDPWGNAESRVRTLAHEANNEAGADVAIHLFRAAHDAALRRPPSGERAVEGTSQPAGTKRVVRGNHRRARHATPWPDGAREAVYNAVGLALHVLYSDRQYWSERVLTALEPFVQQRIADKVTQLQENEERYTFLREQIMTSYDGETNESFVQFDNLADLNMWVAAKDNKAIDLAIDVARAESRRVK